MRQFSEGKAAFAPFICEENIHRRMKWAENEQRRSTDAKSKYVKHTGVIICVHSILNSDQLSPIRWQTCGNAPLTSVRKQNTNSSRVRILTRSIKRSNYLDAAVWELADHPHLCSGPEQAPLVSLFSPGFY